MIARPDSTKEHIRGRGLALGFDKVGFAPPILAGEVERLASWLASDHHGEMRWMAREPERRADANRSHPGTKTVICCALNYYQGPPKPIPFSQGAIASYARGTDYHRILETKLEALARHVEDSLGVRTRVYVDTGPLLEKGYAQAAGLGWLGKHSNLISRQGSSWFFLGEILVPVELPPDSPERDHCGRCSRCIAACPTRAIVQPYVVDSRLCISYLTIELRGPIPRELRPAMGQRIFGCDDCQDVCPWNRFARKADEAAFFPKEPLASMELARILDMSRDEFMALTRRSAIRRARYAGLLRNAAVALGNSGNPASLPALTRALDHPEPLVRGHAAWALGRIRAGEAVPRLKQSLAHEQSEEARGEIVRALRSFETTDSC